MQDCGRCLRLWQPSTLAGGADKHEISAESGSTEDVTNQGRRAWDSNPEVLTDASFQDWCNSHSANPPGAAGTLANYWKRLAYSTAYSIGASPGLLPDSAPRTYVRVAYI